MSDLVHISPAATLLQKVDNQVERLAEVENGLERGYAILGYLLLEVHEMQVWRLHFTTFGAYLESLGARFNRSAKRLQLYFLTVRDLSDTFNRKELEDIGITKALEARRAKDGTTGLSEALRAATLDPEVTVKALKRLIATTLCFPEEEKADWMDLGCAFYVTPEERATIEQAVNAAKRDKEHPIKSDRSESAQMKEVLLRFAMEFIGSHPSE